MHDINVCIIDVPMYIRKGKRAKSNLIFPGQKKKKLMKKKTYGIDLIKNSLTFSSSAKRYVQNKKDFLF